MQKLFILLAVCVCSTIGILAQNDSEITQGTLAALTQKGSSIGNCPLKHTDVKVEISGFLARARVRQEFENNFNQPIEVVYKFPLPASSAVDDMTMQIGERTIRAKIMPRTAAAELYEKSKTEGKSTAILYQERPNLFTQQVANILPNEKIVVEISFVETLNYEDGEYEFVFPMTVGERYIPTTISTANAFRVTPVIAESRAGHDISIEVNLNAGVPVEQIRSTSHPIETLNFSPNSASIKLKDANTIPNKDFILRFDITGKRIEDALLAHWGERGGFFTLLLAPPEKIAFQDMTPKEIVFLLDVSGSMSGFPIEKAKEAMRLSLGSLNPNDTFNLITFAGATNMLFEKPEPATLANLMAARNFLASQSGGGGTEMMTAIRAALTPSDSQEHIRIVCFMTDGYVGNDMEIIGEVQKHPKARVFAFGIGSSVNRFLLDKISAAGRGEVEYVALNDDGSKAARKFNERVRTPLLTDISIDWDSLPVVDIYPRAIPDLFSSKPVIIHGRFLKAGKGTIRLKGNVAGQELVREINVNFPDAMGKNDVLATLWARTKIDDLMSRDWRGIQNGNASKELEQRITDLGLGFRLMTQYTSFVAVEDKIRNVAGRPVVVEVPTENPEGVRTQTITRIDESPATRPRTQSTPPPARSAVEALNSAPPPNPPRAANSTGSDSLVKTISGGVINGKAISLPAPPYPAAASAVGASGSVSVQVVIDENGNVISSSAVSGHPLLRSASERAARNSKFSQTQLAGQPVRVSGIITYVFAQGNGKTFFPSSANWYEQWQPTAEVIRRQILQDKLHPRLLEIALENSAVKLQERTRIEVYVTEMTPAVWKKLASLGFVVISQKQKMYIVGEIAFEKLPELAEIAEVLYVLPRVE